MIIFILFAAVMGLQVATTTPEIDRSYSGADRASDQRAMNRGKR